MSHSQETARAKNHTQDLASVIAELTTVVILIADLPESSDLLDSYEVVEFRTTSIGDDIFVEALRLLRN